MCCSPLVCAAEMGARQICLLAGLWHSLLVAEFLLWAADCQEHDRGDKRQAAASRLGGGPSAGRAAPSAARPDSRRPLAGPIGPLLAMRANRNANSSRRSMGRLRDGAREFQLTQDGSDTRGAALGLVVLRPDAALALCVRADLCRLVFRLCLLSSKYLLPSVACLDQ